MEQKLLQSISMGLVQEATAALDTINSNRRATLAKDQIRSLKNSLIGSCTLFTRAIIKGGVHPDHAFSLSDVFIVQIEETNEVSGLVELEYEMLYTLMEALNNEKRPSYNAIVNKTISFIHDEILNHLSLKRIASAMNVHPYYLSKIFKQEVNISIKDYINKKRIEDSKYFLLHSDSSILDIAILLGFCNQSYYTQVFRKYTDMTPLEFRNKYPRSMAQND
jgi:YesN/AraC family two-component response regulator